MDIAEILLAYRMLSSNQYIVVRKVWRYQRSE